MPFCKIYQTASYLFLTKLVIQYKYWIFEDACHLLSFIEQFAFFKNSGPVNIIVQATVLGKHKWVTLLQNKWEKMKLIYFE